MMSGERFDLAVILARGESRRMGYPKGLARQENDGSPFVARIAALYRALEIPVLVVALETAADAYRQVLDEDEHLRVIAAAGGGGTARTLAVAWAAAPEGVTHLWAHPVDLPLVRSATLIELRSRSLERPQRALGVEHGGRPGHPLVFPATFLRKLKEGPIDWCGTDGDMRGALRPEILAACGLELERIDSPDEGVILDFDTDPAGSAEPGVG